MFRMLPWWGTLRIDTCRRPPRVEDAGLAASPRGPGRRARRRSAGRSGRSSSTSSAMLDRFGTLWSSATAVDPGGGRRHAGPLDGGPASPAIASAARRGSSGSGPTTVTCERVEAARLARARRRTWPSAKPGVERDPEGQGSGAQRVPLADAAHDTRDAPASPRQPAALAQHGADLGLDVGTADGSGERVVPQPRRSAAAPEPFHRSAGRASSSNRSSSPRMWSLSMWLRTAASIRPPARAMSRRTGRRAAWYVPPGPPSTRIRRVAAAGAPLDHQAVAERCLDHQQPETSTPIPQRATSADRSWPAPPPDDRPSR